METETIKDLLKSGVNVNVTIGIDELREFLKEIITQTNTEIETVANEKYLTVKEAAKMLKVDSSTLFRWDKKGHLKPVGMTGRKRYKLSDIRMFMEA